MDYWASVLQADRIIGSPGLYSWVEAVLHLCQTKNSINTFVKTNPENELAKFP